MVEQVFKEKDWVVLLNPQNQGYPSHYANTVFEIFSVKSCSNGQYVIGDIKSKNPIIKHISSGGIYSKNCRKALFHEIPAEHRKNILETLELW